MKTQTKRAKPVSEATRALLAEMQQDAAPSEDKLVQVRKEIAKLRDLDLEKSALQTRMSEVSQDIQHITQKTLVDLFDEAGVNKLGIDAEGNLPPYEVVIEDYAKANIPEDRQQEAYNFLKTMKSEDLIKTTFTVAFGLKEAKESKTFEKLLEKNDILYSKKQGVPWNTLTSWFKVEHKKKPFSPKVMEMLGATVGRVAKVVKQKEKK